MLQLICSDLDGTLLPYGCASLPGELFPLVRALAQRGVLFCPASGRQYQSLRALFAPVAEHCAFLCENGAVVFYRGRLLAKTPMPRALAEEIAWDMWRGSDGRGEVMLCGQATCYLMTRGRGMEQRIAGIGNNYRLVRVPADVKEDIVKVSLYVREGVGPFVERFVPRWQQANAAVAGPDWIDTTLANKGTGVRALCAALGIDLARTAAFGDNYNDVPMLDAVGVPCIMSGAAGPLRARYARQTADVCASLRAFLTQGDI